MSEKKVPKLRFPEFSGEWVQSSIGKLCQVKTGAKDTQNKVEDGLYPFFVRSDNVERINSYSYDGEAILTAGDGVGVGKVFHYINGKFDYHQRVYNIHDFKNAYGRYIYYYFSNSFYNHVSKLSAKNSVDSVRRDMIVNMLISIPVLEEQTQIADFLTSIDDKIQQLTQKQVLLEQYKKRVMRDIFSQKIRFKDDNGNDYPDWQEKNLGEVANKCTLKNKDTNINFVLTNSAINGIVAQLDYFTKDIANQNNLAGYLVVNTHDFVYNPRISVSAPVGPINCNYLNTGVMSPLYTVFRFSKGLVRFFEYYFKTNMWHEYMKSIANYGARDDRMNITSSGFFEMPMLYPYIDEQVKIVNFLTDIDDKLTQVNTQLEQNKLFKKSLLQQLFI